jgi:hypothetical protein
MHESAHSVWTDSRVPSTKTAYKNGERGHP